MKKALSTLSVGAVIFAAYGLLYLYAYRNLDVNAMGSHPLGNVAEAERDSSFLAKVLAPLARAHQNRLQSQSAQHLEGTWVLVDPASFASVVPETLEFTREAGNLMSCSPTIRSGEDTLQEFEVTQWLKPDYPTGLFTGGSVSIFLLSDARTGVQTSEMDVFGVGAEYQRRK